MERVHSRIKVSCLDLRWAALTRGLAVQQGDSPLPVNKFIYYQ